MTVQRTAATPKANLVETKRLQRTVAVATGFAIEAILIAAVVLSNIGVSPASHPTPGGPSAGRIPAPAGSGQTR